MNVVVVGASNIVGKPMALMLMQHEATVCICHAKTRDLAQFTLLADVLVVAAGYPNLILPQMVRTGAVVIDVGINRLADGRLVFGFPGSGLLIWEPGEPKGRRITHGDGLPGEQIGRMSQDHMHDPPLLLVPTDEGLAVFRSIP